MRRSCSNPQPDEADSSDGGTDDDDEYVTRAWPPERRAPHTSLEPSPALSSWAVSHAAIPGFDLGAAGPPTPGRGGSAGMMNETRKRLQQLRSSGPAAPQPVRYESSYSTDEGAADGHGAGAGHDGGGAADGSETDQPSPEASHEAARHEQDLDETSNEDGAADARAEPAAPPMAPLLFAS